MGFSEAFFLKALGRVAAAKGLSGVWYLEILHYFLDDAKRVDTNRANFAVMWEDTECRRTSPWAT
jgi:hypothetical protein